MQVGFITHTGRRPSNQDNALVDPERAVYAVADGVGGGNAGEVAAATVCLELARALRQGMPCSQGLLNAHQELRKRALEDRAAGYSASTIAGVSFHRRQAEIWWVGDSRVYLVRDRELLQLTHDHRLEGAQHILTQAIGAPLPHPLRIASLAMPRRAGDVWLVCTDGLYNTVEPEQVLDCVLRGLNPQDMAEELQSRSLRQGADDNLTLILIRDEHPSPPPRPPRVATLLSGTEVGLQPDSGGSRAGTPWTRRLLAGLVLLGLLALLAWLAGGR